MECRVFHDDLPSEWDEYVCAHPWGLVFQTRAWSRALNETGRCPVGFLVVEKNRLVGGALLAVRRIPVCGCLAESPGGILMDVDDPERAGRIAETIIASIKAYARSNAIVACALAMRMPSGEGDDRPAYARRIRKALMDVGIRENPEVLGTYLQAIDLDDEELLKSFGKNCRRDIRRAQRDGIVVNSTGESEELEVFYQSYRQLCILKGIDYAPEALMIRGLGHVFRAGAARLFQATYEDSVVNSAIVSTVGIPRYLFGASPPSTRERSLPPTGQILHYEIMRWQREHGARLYDWGESPGPDPVKGHPNYGVWRFKHSFGGRWVYHLGHWNWVLSPARYRAWRAVITAAARVRQTVRLLRRAKR